jgi:hypothetical protein
VIKTILFVHGTGVREASYVQTAARIVAGLADIEWKAGVRPCNWGDTYGASLAYGGISIPEFTGEAPPSEADQALAALWQLLATDPMFELRELAGRKPPDFTPPNAQALALQFRVKVAALATLDEAKKLLCQKVLPHYWEDAVAAVAKSDALENATKPPRTVSSELRVAVGRAIAAQLQYQLADDNFAALNTTLRDELATAVTDELGGRDKNFVTDWVKDRFKGLALRWATSQARRQRDVLYNAAYPAAGDILLYQVCGKEIRDKISADIQACGDDTAVIAHSLGGIACVDLLIEKDHPNVKLLVTCGSQAPLLYELGALRSLKPKNPLPGHFPKTWLNFYDCNDLLSYRAAKVFSGPPADRRTLDIEIVSNQPFPISHSAYWDQAALWTRLKPYLA